MSPHELLDRRALEMDRIVAERLAADGAVLDKAKKVLDDWFQRAGDTPPAVLNEWKEILQQPREKILEVLLGEDERSARLRQSSPFCGILTREERTGILLRHR
jgi:hypothetical protein